MRLIIPIAYMVHEKKYQGAHEDFWRYIKQCLPEINEVGYIVTDCERGLRNAKKIYFPEAPLWRCWNHLWKSIEQWVIRRKGKEYDVDFYTEGVREVLMQDSLEKYRMQLDRRKNGYTNQWIRQVPAWDPVFVTYYDEHIAPDAENLAAHSVEPICKDFFNRFTGITTNSAEGLNNLFKSISKYLF